MPIGCKISQLSLTERVNRLSLNWPVDILKRKKTCRHQRSLVTRNRCTTIANTPMKEYCHQAICSVGLTSFCSNVRPVVWPVVIFPSLQLSVCRSDCQTDVAKLTLSAVSLNDEKLYNCYRVMHPWGVLIYKSVSDPNVTIVQPRDMNFRGRNT